MRKFFHLPRYLLSLPFKAVAYPFRRFSGKKRTQTVVVSTQEPNEDAQTDCESGQPERDLLIGAERLSTRCAELGVNVTVDDSLIVACRHQSEVFVPGESLPGIVTLGKQLQAVAGRHPELLLKLYELVVVFNLQQIFRHQGVEEGDLELVCELPRPGEEITDEYRLAAYKEFSEWMESPLEAIGEQLVATYWPGCSETQKALIGVVHIPKLAKAMAKRQRRAKKAAMAV